MSVIDDDEVLWRRVPGNRKKPDPGNPSGWRAHSDNFKGPKDHAGVSVDRAELHHPNGPEAVLAMEPTADATWGVLAISAGQVRAAGHEVVPDPIDEPGLKNPAHALIVPLPNDKVSKKLVKQASWALPPLVPPPPP